MTTLNALEQLFIRACKSRDPHKRVRSVYRRFYVSYGLYEDHTVDVASILATIADKHVPIERGKLIDALAPQGLFPQAEKMPYWDRVLNTMISQIRLQIATSFPGYRPPLALRKSFDLQQQGTT